MNSHGPSETVVKIGLSFWSSIFTVTSGEIFTISLFLIGYLFRFLGSDVGCLLFGRMFEAPNRLPQVLTDLGKFASPEDDQNDDEDND